MLGNQACINEEALVQWAQIGSDSIGEAVADTLSLNDQSRQS